MGGGRFGAKLGHFGAVPPCHSFVPAGGPLPGMMPLPDTASGLEWASLVNAAKAYEGAHPPRFWGISPLFWGVLFLFWVFYSILGYFAHFGGFLPHFGGF